MTEHAQIHRHRDRWSYRPRQDDAGSRPHGDRHGSPSRREAPRHHDRPRFCFLRDFRRQTDLRFASASLTFLATAFSSATCSPEPAVFRQSCSLSRPTKASCRRRWSISPSANLLGISQGLTVITKADAVSASQLQEVTNFDREISARNVSCQETMLPSCQSVRRPVRAFEAVRAELTESRDAHSSRDLGCLDAHAARSFLCHEGIRHSRHRNPSIGNNSRWRDAAPAAG